MEPRAIWPLPVAVVNAVAVFAATVFAYTERARLHQGGSYRPAGIGLVVFFVIMFVLTVAMVRREDEHTAGLVFSLETLAFGFILMLLLSNVYGS